MFADEGGSAVRFPEQPADSCIVTTLSDATYADDVSEIAVAGFLEIQLAFEDATAMIAEISAAWEKVARVVLEAKSAVSTEPGGPGVPALLAA